jgi:hypothetical protein
MRSMRGGVVMRTNIPGCPSTQVVRPTFGGCIYDTRVLCREASSLDLKSRPDRPHVLSLMTYRRWRSAKSTASERMQSRAAYRLGRMRSKIMRI